MAIKLQPSRIMRAPEYRRSSGITKSGEYRARHAGLLPPPILLGPRSTGLPDHEVEIVNSARIAGTPECELRKIVARLVAARAVDINEMLADVGA